MNTRKINKENIVWKGRNEGIFLFVDGMTVKSSKNLLKVM